MSRRENIAVIFDMDGVLIDSKGITLASLTEVFRALGVPAVLEDFAPYAGTGEENMIRSVLAKYDSAPPYTPEIKRRVLEAYVKKAEQSLRPFEGVPAMLGAVHALGVKMAVGSSADKVKVRANIRALGIPPGIFQAVVTGEEVARKKPAPDVFLAAAEKLGMPPSACVVIEDATNGIRAAKNAGMRSVAVLTSYGRAEIEVEGPDYICGRPSGLLQVIEEIVG